MTPIHRLKKTEIVYLATHNCEHKHTYLTHYACYLRDHPDLERLGFLDIEASNLDADFGIILSWCIKDANSKKIHEGRITRHDIESAEAGDEDKRVVQELVGNLKYFDHVVTYYGTKFDIPYIRTRAVACGVDFPVFGTLKHTDLYYIVRHRFKLSSNRLENACRVIMKKTQKTRIDSKFWRGGARGDEASLAYILDHNRKDVLDLEALYQKVILFSRKVERSA